MAAARMMLLAGLMSAASVCGGMGFEGFGPAAGQRFPTTPQPDWPAGMPEIVDHESRVYHFWVNGSESHYFLMAQAEIPEMLRAFSRLRLRDHIVTVKQGVQIADSFHGEKTAYNVSYHYLGGIARSMRRLKLEAVTHEPTMTIGVDPQADRGWWTTADLPANLIINSEVKDWPAHGAAAPERRLWRARVRFEDGGPAVDFAGRVSTRVFLWDHVAADGVYLGRVDHEGNFHVALSDEEVARLGSGASWMTLTVGGARVAPRADDPRLAIGSLSAAPGEAPLVSVPRPGRRFHPAAPVPEMLD